MQSGPTGGPAALQRIVHGMQRAGSVVLDVLEVLEDDLATLRAVGHALSTACYAKRARGPKKASATTVLGSPGTMPEATTL